MRNGDQPNEVVQVYESLLWRREMTKRLGILTQKQAVYQSVSIFDKTRGKRSNIPLLEDKANSECSRVI